MSGVRTWDLWLVSVLLMGLAVVGVVYLVRQQALCEGRGGVYVAGKCLRKDVVLP